MKELHESGENYLEVIWDIQREQGHVRSVEVARRVGVSRASVSKALGVLREAGLVEPSFYGEVVLTGEGVKRAKEVRARHDLLLRFLRDGLGVAQEIAERDACRIEHVVSRELLAHVSRWLYQKEKAEK
ncbi:metal-dependent transcriptional regulator [Intestinibacillus massiliensis]|uniref:metal-dependent transcriptional regulator n=1 Tax=Intestinibacillus massiliensis TaxID=1871029 RepID=UPI001D0944EC|nr:metal-dependent transcriptional regulator [Intestinibacillus massiliensis]MCB6365548.1 metal-dependent transcriptional regulator [Intestinibacillus massiliensis]